MVGNRARTPGRGPRVTDVRIVYAPPVKEASEPGLPIRRSPVGAGLSSAGPVPLNTNPAKRWRDWHDTTGRQAELVTAAAWKAVEPREGPCRGSACSSRQLFRDSRCREMSQTEQGVAQPGSAPARGAGGRAFKSLHLDHCLPLLLQREPRLMPILKMASASRIGFQKPREGAGGVRPTSLYRLGRGCSSL